MSTFSLLKSYLEFLNQCLILGQLTLIIFASFQCDIQLLLNLLQFEIVLLISGFHTSLILASLSVEPTFIVRQLFIDFLDLSLPFDLAGQSFLFDPDSLPMSMI